jgi:ABC-type transport system substrate-binding protein
MDRGDSFARAGKLLFQDQFNMGTFHPSIAESYELKQTAEGDYYVDFKLKEGLKFPDGTDIDAEAVKYCWDREQFVLPAREVQGTNYHVFYTSTSWKEVEAIDKYTFRMWTADTAGKFLPHIWAGMFAFTMAMYIAQHRQSNMVKKRTPLNLM